MRTRRLRKFTEEGLIARLAQQRGWIESLSDEKRAECMTKVLEALIASDKPREIAQLARTLAAFEKNDLDRARLLEAIDDAEDTSDKVDLWLQRLAAAQTLSGFDGGNGRDDGD